MGLLPMEADILPPSNALSISQDEAERARFRSRRKYQTDHQSDIATAKDNGKAERSIEIARNALEMKLAVADIAKLTGLTCEEIEHLRTGI